METLTQIFGYLFPTGLGAAFGWMLNWYRNRKISKAKQGTDIDTAYLDNINLLREELIKIQDENRKLYRAIARLDRTVAKATSCRHWDDCPIRNELQKSGSDDNRPQHRQSAQRKRIRADTRAGAAQRGEDGVSDIDPESDTGGDGIQ